MLKKFEVEGFKNFKDKFTFDLKARDYAYNKHLVKNGIVNKGIIYGKNGIGKSNLGLAIFDIVTHLTDKNRNVASYTNNYLNVESNTGYAMFRYYFYFDGEEIIYEYKKTDFESLLEEKLIVNDNEILYHNFTTSKDNHIDQSLIKNLKIDLPNNKLSILKYIYRNSTIGEDNPIYKVLNFVNNMLWYRCLIEGNDYLGFNNGSAVLSEGIYQKGKKDEFEAFLKEHDINYKLDWQIINGIHTLMAVFPDGKQVPFLTLASTGTKALELFFYWSIVAFSEISFLFIDEMDAFLHYESAAKLLERINKSKNNFQCFITSHNTYLMNNEISRPDCLFIMTEGKIACLSDCTSKELREAHNLEKIYINGGFSE